MWRRYNVIVGKVRLRIICSLLDEIAAHFFDFICKVRHMRYRGSLKEVVRRLG